MGPSMTSQDQSLHARGKRGKVVRLAPGSAWLWVISLRIWSDMIPNNDFHISKSAFPLHLTELREQRDLLRFLWWACMELDLQLVQPFGPTVYSAWALGCAVGRGDACRAGELEECAQNKGFENQTGHNGKMRQANNGETMQNSLLAWFWAWNCRTNVHSIEYTHLKRWSQAMFALLNWIAWNNICNPFLYQLASRLTLVPLRSSHMHVK